MPIRLLLPLLLALAPVAVAPSLAQQLPSRLAQATSPRDQLWNSFRQSCVANDTQNTQRVAYCRCVFDAMTRRYTTQQIVRMNQLVVSGGPTVAEFNAIAFEPDFAICRARSGFRPSRSSGAGR
jgi:hypothetical protein